MTQFPSGEASRFSASKQFPTFYGNRKFITAFTGAFHLSFSWARSIQFMPPTHFTSRRYILILSSHLRLGLLEIEHTVSKQVLIRRKWFRVTNITDNLSSRSWGSSDHTGNKLLAGERWNQSSISESVRHLPVSEASRPVLRSSQSYNPEVLGLNQQERKADCHINLRGVVRN